MSSLKLTPTPSGVGVGIQQYKTLFIMTKELLGLIAGNGKFPLLFAQKARSQDYKVVAAGIRGDTSFFLRFFVDKCKWFKVGDLKKLL